MSEIAISVEKLSKSYLLGHNTTQGERYTALRDVLANNVRNLARKTRDMFQGKAIVQGDEVEEFWALKDINFEIKQGERVGIIGGNGAGKSTLLKILSRITEPSRGRVLINGRVASLLEVGTGFHPELTGRENIFLNGAILGMSRNEVIRRFDEIVAFSEVEKFLDTPIKRYSSGMYVKLAFGVAAHLESDILILDEVLAVGDIKFQQKCIGKMEDVSRNGKTILFVSHNMDAIKKMCTNAIFLSSGEIKYKGSTNAAIEKYIAELTTNSKFEINNNLIYSNSVQTAFYISKVEVFDDLLNDVHEIRTWDNVILKITFFCEHEVNSGSISFTLKDAHGSNLSIMQTQPDQNKQISLRAGFNHINLRIEKIPLAAGIYNFGVGISIPKIEWLFREDNAGQLIILEEDVYESGLSPDAERYLLAMNVTWSDVVSE